MYVVDYIMMNYDRHMKNYGLIRNVETLKFTRVMPIFDTGQSLNCNKLLDEISFNNGICKLFSKTESSFEDLLKHINFEKYDFNLLKDIPYIADTKLHEYIRYTEMSEERINKIVNGLKLRIDFLINEQAKRK